MEGLSLPIVMSLGVHLGALLFGCVVSFGVCNLCLNIPTEGTVKQGLTVLQKLKIKTLVKSTRDTTLNVFFSYFQDVRFQRSAIHMCRTPK